MSEDTTLADLLQLNLHKYEDEVRNIVDKAVKESGMEKVGHAPAAVPPGGPDTDSLSQSAPQVVTTCEALQASTLEESLVPSFTQPGTEIM